MTSQVTVERLSAHDQTQTMALYLSPSKRPLPNEMQEPSTAEILRWTLTSDAVAPCFVRDVFAMKENPGNDYDVDFFWLGRVPCRNVKVVGMVVGIQVYETRTVYTVDDGTSVIECTHRQQHRSPSKRFARTDFKPPALPKPLARLGWSVMVVGRIARLHDSRQLLVESIARCPSVNDEPNHWRTVRALHEASYSLPGPFVIPSLKPETQARDISIKLQPAIPSMPTTPSSSLPASSSPIRSSPTKQSPTKLRHPSRLHSRDLTFNTFRIYVKHYMDNALSDTNLDIDDAPPSPPTTPTKPSRTRVSVDTLTPRPLAHSNHTPRPATRILPPAFDARNSNKLEIPPELRGFTLSYLRRAPELAEMARRVVKAEAKRRYRDERKIAKSATQRAGRSQIPGSTNSTNKTQSNEPIRFKVKRLFISAIRDLHKEGSIVLCDGLVRPCVDETFPTSGLWKSNASTSTAGADSTVLTSISGISQIDDEDEGELSDPEPNEEAYIPLTPSFLAQQVERVILSLTTALVSKDAGGRQRQITKPTKEQILRCLRGDDRWRTVGMWAIEEALELLSNEGRAWSTGGGMWELCL